jgi:hypothetical protein
MVTTDNLTYGYPRNQRDYSYQSLGARVNLHRTSTRHGWDCSTLYVQMISILKMGDRVKIIQGCILDMQWWCRLDMQW